MRILLFVFAVVSSPFAFANECSSVQLEAAVDQAKLELEHLNSSGVGIKVEKIRGTVSSGKVVLVPY